jgi:hypothetical protein
VTKPKDYAPVSNRVGVLGSELTAAQKAAVSRLVSEPSAPSPLFSEAFDKAGILSPKINAINEKLKDTTTKGMRIIHKDRLRKLNAQFETLTNRNKDFNQLVLRYAEENGGKLENVMRFIQWFRRKRPHDRIEDKALRARIKKTFGFVGRPGRPKT